MIVLSLGGNLPHIHYGAPPATLCHALRLLREAGTRILGRSSWYETQPQPDDGEPWFVNAVVTIATRLKPAELLAVLHRTEAALGRVRGARNAPRIIDLDLIAYNELVIGSDVAAQRRGELVVPHPLMHERRFVLQPMIEIAPGWRHPRLGRTIEELLEELPPEPVVRRAGTLRCD